MTNPFEDVERKANEELDRYLALARALDEMEGDVTSWEAEFLDTIIKQLRDERRMLSQKQIETLNRMCEQYGVE